MKLRSILHALLAFGAFGVALTKPTQHASQNLDLDLDRVEIPAIQKDHGGWVNPEDLMPMPQCIAQQDQSSWLNAMTKCTRHRCTSHFGLICTHYQWLTQLSCLSVEFSPTTIERYVEYCSRSILAKAQLYHWIQHVTGRTWLVHVGDANGLQNLWPTSLRKGYGPIVDVVNKAPACLQKSVSSPSKESFQHAMGSCSFTSKALHTGNADRPWEYSTSRKSMIALSFDTVGYDVTKRHISPGLYFDKECFCSTFAISQQYEPCSTSDQLALTKERLWMNATCGPASLPENWTSSLKILGFSYTPLKDWHLPGRISDMPREITDFTQQCTTDACQLDSDGYCKTESAIDRNSFCRNINYDLCQGSCQALQTRRQYVYWLHGLCGGVEGWHGLPNNWREMITPQPRDMIPWQWTLKPGNTEQEGECPSNEWKLGSIAFANLATLLIVFFSNGRRHRNTAVNIPTQSGSPRWISGGLLLASLQLCANWANVKIIQSTPGYEDVPTFQLMLLWCSLPRLGWLPISSQGIYHPGAKHLALATSALFAEVVLQGFAFYHMTLTVNYGRQNNFYLGGLADAKEQGFAWLIYAGALIWLIVVAMMAVPFIRTIHANFSPDSLASTAPESLSNHDGREFTTPKDDEADVYEPLLPKPHWSVPPNGEGVSYGTLPAKYQSHELFGGPLATLYMIMAMALPFLWLAQWLFWAGFVVLSSEDFCPPSLDVLTAVWMAASFGSVVVKSYL